MVWLTEHFDMTLAVDWDFKHKPNKKSYVVDIYYKEESQQMLKLMDKKIFTISIYNFIQYFNVNLYEHNMAQYMRS